MIKVIKSLSNKLVKLEIDNKKPAQQNRGVFNPQFRKQPLQILQRERKDQDQVQAPLYIEAAPSRSVDDNEKEDEDQISAVYMEDGESEEEIEKEYEEESKETDISFVQEEMDDYCKQFTNFMQSELHKKYDLRSKKRLRTQDDEVKESESLPTPMPTPLQKDQIKKLDKGK